MREEPRFLINYSLYIPSPREKSEEGAMEGYYFLPFS